MHSNIHAPMDPHPVHPSQVVLSAVEKSGKLDAGEQPAEFFFNLLRTLLYLIALGSKEVASPIPRTP